MLGTGETIIAEVQINVLLDRVWDRCIHSEIDWDDFKEMINNYFEERENEGCTE
jgi:hypothetical protein